MLGDLGAHLEGILDFCDFKDVSGTKKYLIFEVSIDIFWIQFLVFFFLNAHVSGFFVILGAQWLQNGSHLEIIFRTFLMTGNFLIFATPTVRNLDF